MTLAGRAIVAHSLHRDLEQVRDIRNELERRGHAVALGVPRLRGRGRGELLRPHRLKPELRTSEPPEGGTPNTRTGRRAGKVWSSEFTRFG